MNFNDIAVTIFESAKKELRKVKNDADNKCKEIDSKWLDKVNTKINSIKSDSKDSRTIGEVIESAKKERQTLLSKMESYYNDTEKQINMSKRLYDLNMVISSYETAFNEKEASKHDVLKNNVTLVIKKMINLLSEEANKEIEKLSTSIQSKSNKIIDLAGKEDLFDELLELSNLNKELIKYKNLSKSLEELKTYNGNISSDKKLNELTDGLEGNFEELVNACYKLIVSNNVDLSKQIVNDGKTDNTKIDKIKKLLKKAEDGKDIKSLEEAEKLINELEDSKQKEELLKKALETRSLITKDEDFAFALKMVEELEEKDQKAGETGKKQDVLRADDVLDTEDFVNKLENSKNQEKLLKRLSIIKRNIQKRFTDLLGKLEKNIKNGVYNSYESVDKLAFMFNELVDTSAFDKNVYGNRVSNVIREYNVTAQDEYKKTLANNTDSEKAYTKGEIILEGFSTLFTKVSRSKLVRRLRQKLLDKAIENDDEEKVEKYTAKIHNSDIVNSFKLFTSINKLNKLKPVLFKNGLSELKNKTKRKYYKAKNNISRELYNGLIDLAGDKDVFENHERAKTVANQFINELSVSNDFNSDSMVVRGFLDDSLECGGLTDPEYSAYIDEIENIECYASKNEDSIYEVTLEELENDSAKYFEKPYLYEDEKIVRALPYIKRY